jgi:uncharacterized Zn finger protein (UPF0148 family)
MSTKKIVHPINKTYMCGECIFVFTVHSKMQKGKKTVCPSCGDSVEVVKYQTFSEPNRKIYETWTDEELKLIDKLVEGKAKIYQVAALTGRSFGSVRLKRNRRREELKNEFNKTV